MTTAERIREAEDYLKAREGCYEWRCARYDAALEAMHGLGLSDSHTVVDVGSGWGEFGARMHTGGPVAVNDYRGPSCARYIPVDAAIDGTDLADWMPPRRAEFFVCLEVLEHLDDPADLLSKMVLYADKAVIISTPNPLTTDVLGMDPTHRCLIGPDWLRDRGFVVREESFYGKPADSLFGVWTAAQHG